MKRECSIVRDVLPLYFENMVSEDTAVFVKEHLENCSDCAAELECLKSGKKLIRRETSERENDTNVITAVKKKIAKRIFKIVGVVCLVFVVYLVLILLYIVLVTLLRKIVFHCQQKQKVDYAYILLEAEAGKSLSFDSKTEDIVNDKNEICGQKNHSITNLQYQ